MTTTSEIPADAATNPPRSWLQRRKWILLGVGLLGGSVALSAVVAGMWVALGVLAAVVVGTTLWAQQSAASTRRRRGRPVAAAEAQGPVSPAGRDVMAQALRHDLPFVAATAHDLPMGGTLTASLLAEHTYLVVDALGLVLAVDSRREQESQRKGGEARAARRAELWDQADEVRRRIDRLYSATRPGGLDHIDQHLAQLWLLSEDYLAGPKASGDDYGGASAEYARRATRTTVGDRRHRARILAWSAVASGIDIPRPLSGEPRLTRMCLRFGSYRLARRRARRLWGSAGDPGATREPPAATGGRPAAATRA